DRRERSSAMYDTRNELPEPTRSRAIEILEARLADVIDLQLQAKQAHWNVKGPHFIALHELFDEVAEAVEGYVDLVAERIVQLGGVAEGTIQAVAKKSKLPPYPMDIVGGVAHVEALAAGVAAFGKRSREAIDMLDEIGGR